MSVNPTTKAPTASVEQRTNTRPVAIEVRGLEKAFRIPTHRIDSFKERAVHPLARAEYRELRALRDVSFDVHRGEFFGIVGRNGSGKSTLLKILASIYRADAGRIRMAGRVAPFIELGVGFNAGADRARERGAQRGDDGPLAARGAARGSTACSTSPSSRDFVDLKLKNYSSGMMVRLAFAVMIQAEADILLIDEVLAVGDAAFQQKCARRLPRDARLRHDGRAGHPRHDGDRCLLRPGDADPRRRAALHRRPGGGGPAYFRQNFSRRRREPLGRQETRRARTSTPALEDAGSRTSRASASRTSRRASRSACAAVLEARQRPGQPRVRLRVQERGRGDRLRLQAFARGARRGRASTRASGRGSRRRSRTR